MQIEMRGIDKSFGGNAVLNGAGLERFTDFWERMVQENRL